MPYFGVEVDRPGISARSVAEALAAGVGVPADKITVTPTELPAAMWERVAAPLARMYVMSRVSSDPTQGSNLGAAMEIVAALAGGVEVATVHDLLDDSVVGWEPSQTRTWLARNRMAEELAAFIVPKLADLAARAQRAARQRNHPAP